MQNKLEIILITYNRKGHLENTFSQIFSDTSPIKNFDIIILDNQSTDGMSELIQKYANMYPNIKHIIHNRNIGGNANIARAFEIAQKEYVWILCDDDEYKWDNWQEVEDAVLQGHDAIVVANYVNPEKNKGQLLKQLSFVPAAIYKTENITSTVMVNIEFNISNMFPHLVLPCHLINENKSMYICSDWCVRMVVHGGIETYSRGLDKSVHPYMANMFWSIGFINTCQLIKDKALRKQILHDVTEVPHGTWRENLEYIVICNNVNFFSFKKNWLDAFSGFSKVQKVQFLLALLYYQYSPICIYQYDHIYNSWYLKLFWKFKIRIWSDKWIKK